MKADYRTLNAFFVSPVGRRLQKQIKSVLSRSERRTHPSVLIGPVFPFLAAFEQQNPEIVFERETVDEDDFFFSLPPVCSTETFFISALNASVDANRFLLIKEAFRLLKPEGKLLLLVKRTGSVFVNGIPETPLGNVRNELKEACFSLTEQKGMLHFPYNFPFFDKADDFLFRLSVGKGAFTLFIAQKNAVTASAATENYSSARITNASVFTSPRT